MVRLAKFLASLAVVSAAIGIAMILLVSHRDGISGLWFLSSVAVMLALMSSALSLLLAAILYARRDAARPLGAVWLSLAALAACGSYLLLI